MEAIMAYAARPHEFHSAMPTRASIPASVPSGIPASRPGFWRRLLDHVIEAQQRAAQRSVEEYLARNGKLTDSMEREIAERPFGQRKNLF
jgi:hypothetical protein